MCSPIREATLFRDVSNAAAAMNHYHIDAISFRIRPMITHHIDPEFLGAKVNTLLTTHHGAPSYPSVACRPHPGEP